MLNVDAVDLDQPDSWPAPVRAWTQRCADRLRGTTICTNDLSSELIKREAEFRALFGEHKLLVYHCTRLLDSEVEAIRESGLLPLSQQLVAARIRSAAEQGALSAVERARLEQNDVYMLGDQRGREDQICFILGRSVFDDDPEGCERLLSLWGGEAIYWALSR